KKRKVPRASAPRRRGSVGVSMLHASRIVGERTLARAPDGGFDAAEPGITLLPHELGGKGYGKNLVFAVSALGLEGAGWVVRSRRDDRAHCRGALARGGNSAPDRALD